MPLFKFIIETECIEVHSVIASTLEDAKTKYDNGEASLDNDELQDSYLVQIECDGQIVEVSDDERERVASVEREAELVAALTELFKQCAMIHRHWGDGCNQQEATAAIDHARKLINLPE
jgi:hypothetical protein